MDRDIATYVIVWGIEAARRMTDDFFTWVTELVRTQRSRLIGVAKGEGLGDDDAVDAAQEAFLTFLLMPRARELVGVVDESGRLLTTIAKNAARNRRRRKHRAAPHEAEALEQLGDGAPSADELLASADDHARLAVCVDRLGDVQRKIVHLRMLDELPGDEVAALLGIPAGRVAVYLHRAKASLRECMCETDTETEGA
jgi:RNA polymerase sigma-70 factor (ECF subfamily)